MPTIASPAAAKRRPAAADAAPASASRISTARSHGPAVLCRFVGREACAGHAAAPPERRGPAARQQAPDAEGSGRSGGLAGGIGRDARRKPVASQNLNRKRSGRWATASARRAGRADRSPGSESEENDDAQGGDPREDPRTVPGAARRPGRGVRPHRPGPHRACGGRPSERLHGGGRPVEAVAARCRRRAAGWSICATPTTPTTRTLGEPGRRAAVARGGGQALKEVFAAGHHHHRLWPRLGGLPEDLVIDKMRFSGFTPGPARCTSGCRSSGSTRRSSPAR